MPTRTPITDAVRDRKGDYLAAVENLEQGHAALLEVCKDIAKRYVPGGTKKHCWLCNGNSIHFPGCLYPMAVDAVAKAERLLSPE